MVSAVAGAAVRAAVHAYTTPSAPAAPADSQAQLQRLQHQLSDNVNCASAKTSQGKATIAAIQEKISALKDQMDGKPTAAAPATTAAADTAAATSKTDSAKPAAPVGSTSGNLIDTYA